MRLVCLSGPQKGASFELKPGETSIGRGDLNSVVCLDSKASRNHCRLIFDGQYLTIADLESTNGTRVNNLYLNEPRYLQHGDHIQIGQTIFLIDAGAPEPPVFDPAAMPAGTPYMVTHTSVVRKQTLERSGRPDGYIAYAAVP